jgi:hypothetical protein
MTLEQSRAADENDWQKALDVYSISKPTGGP